MSEWKEYELGNIATFRYGKMTEVKMAGKYPVHSGYRIVGYTDNANYQKGSTIIVARGVGGTGDVKVLPFDCWITNLSIIVDFNKTIVNDKFFYYQHLLNNLAELDSGSAQSQITIQDLNFLKISLPTLSEQIQIATILSSLDDKIDLLHRQNKTLEQLAESLFRKWFVEEAEDNWKEALLGEFISVKHGYAFKGNCISAEPTNLILVTPGNFKIGGGFKFDKFKYYTSDKFPTVYIFKTGDLVVTMTDLSVQGDSLGYPAIIPENHANELYLHNQRVGKIEFKKEISKSFIYQLMKTRDYQWFILGGASGTSIRHTSPTSICSYSFSLPPKQKLLDFEQFSIGLEEKIKSNQNQIRTLTQLRDTLLPKLMSGEVKLEIN